MNGAEVQRHVIGRSPAARGPERSALPWIFGPVGHELCERPAEGRAGQAHSMHGIVGGKGGARNIPPGFGPNSKASMHG